MLEGLETPTEQTPTKRNRMRHFFAYTCFAGRSWGRRPLDKDVDPRPACPKAPRILPQIRTSIRSVPNYKKDSWSYLLLSKIRNCPKGFVRFWWWLNFLPDFIAGASFCPISARRNFSSDLWPIRDRFLTDFCPFFASVKNLRRSLCQTRARRNPRFRGRLDSTWTPAAKHDMSLTIEN